jgi:hypothetical protein
MRQEDLPTTVNPDLTAPKHRGNIPVLSWLTYAGKAAEWTRKCSDWRRGILACGLAICLLEGES